MTYVLMVCVLRESDQRDLVNLRAQGLVDENDQLIPSIPLCEELFEIVNWKKEGF